MDSVRIARGLRELVTWTVLAALVAAGAGFAWLSRHPDAAVVTAAREWPLVGSLARRFQQRWLPPSPSPWVDSSEDGGSTVSRIVVPVREVEIEDFFDLPERPEDPRAMPWAPEVEPWTGSGPPPLGNDPAPVLPLPGRPADPRRLRTARSLFTSPPLETRLGPYPLLTDIDDPELLSRMDRVATAIEPLYLSRYGLSPVGKARETIVLYRSEQSYRELQGRSERLRGLSSRGHVGWGLVALYAGEDAVDHPVLPVLRHELGHLLNRRSLGPALPPWLDEGLADDLAGFELDDRLAPRELPLGAMRRVEGDQVEIWGALAGLDELARSLGTGEQCSLGALLALDWDAFVEEPQAARNYAASAWLVRYLLDGRSGLRLGFRAFLRGIARGEGAGETQLAAALGRPWSEVEAGWRGYVAARAAAVGVGAPSSPTDVASVRTP